MFQTTGGIGQPHEMLGIVNATAHLMLSSETIDAFESMDQLFVEVQEKMAERAAANGADGIINDRYNTQTVRMQIAPKFLVVTGYGTMVKLIEA